MYRHSLMRQSLHTVIIRIMKFLLWQLLALWQHTAAWFWQSFGIEQKHAAEWYYRPPIYFTMTLGSLINSATCKWNIRLKPQMKASTCISSPLLYIMILASMPSTFMLLSSADQYRSLHGIWKASKPIAVSRGTALPRYRALALTKATCPPSDIFRTIIGLRCQETRSPDSSEKRI